MKKLKLLGLGLLFGLLIVGAPKGCAESDGTIDSEASEEIVEQENEKTVEATDLTIGSDGIEAAEDQIDENLKVTDLVYVEEKDVITGKTEPNAMVACYSSEEGATAGLFRAAEDGSFVVISPPAGMVNIQVTSAISGKRSVPVTIEVTKETGEPSLKITDIIYDPKTKTFSAVTEPNATVYMYMPSTGGQGFVNADAEGNFTVTQDFEPGQEIIFTATNADGKKGEAYHFVIPKSETTETESTTDTTSTESEAKADKGATEDSGEKKGWFPHTGENSGVLVTLVGAVLLVLVGVFYKFKLKRNR